MSVWYVLAVISESCFNFSSSMDNYQFEKIYWFALGGTKVFRKIVTTIILLSKFTSLYFMLVDDVTRNLKYLI